jgi:ketosteroid isomerase-like protein
VSKIQEDTTGRLDLEVLREAIERREVDFLLGLYAEDAELRVLNGDVPSSPAFELRGKAEIERYLRVVFGQRLPSRIEGEIVVGEDRVAFGEVCEYPDGTLVAVKTTLELREGRIVRQADVVSREAPEAGEGGGNREEEAVL